MGNGRITDSSWIDNIQDLEGKICTFENLYTLTHLWNRADLLAFSRVSPMALYLSLERKINGKLRRRKDWRRNVKKSRKRWVWMWNMKWIKNHTKCFIYYCETIVYGWKIVIRFVKYFDHVTRCKTEEKRKEKIFRSCTRGHTIHTPFERSGSRKKEKKREILLAYLISRVNGEEFAFSERIPADRLLKPVIAHMYAQLCS